MNNSLKTPYLLLIVLAGGATALAGAPWWMTAVAGVVAGYFFPISVWRAYGAGFAAGFVLWYGLAFYFNTLNAGLLGGKMGALLGGVSAWQLLVLTGFIGGMLGGLGVWIGVWMRGMGSGR